MSALAVVAGGIRQRNEAAPFADGFRWKAGPPLLAPEGRAEDRAVSVKDPSVVFYGGRWHVYMTIRVPGVPAHMEYAGFRDWQHTTGATRRAIRLDATYHCAPQVFYFRPQHKWYLIYQWTDASRNPPEYGPAFSTMADPGFPQTLTKPIHLFPKKPDNLAGWIDFWAICDDTRAYLFFTSNDGRMWRCSTALSDFPHGWNQPAVALQADIFEASHTYRLKGPGKYLTVVEAQRGGARYYKAYLADRLDGEWRPVADTYERPFASLANVRFAPGVEPWTDSISHGELIRDGCDETMTVDPAHLRFVFQGCSAADRAGKPYGQFPWRIGILDSVR